MIELEYPEDDEDKLMSLTCGIWINTKEETFSEKFSYPVKSHTWRLIISLSHISHGNRCWVRVRPNFRVADVARIGGGAGGRLNTDFVFDGLS
jgi:hypothetical protein